MCPCRQSSSLGRVVRCLDCCLSSHACRVIQTIVSRQDIIPTSFSTVRTRQRITHIVLPEVLRFDHNVALLVEVHTQYNIYTTTTLLQFFYRSHPALLLLLPRLHLISCLYSRRSTYINIKLTLTTFSNYLFYQHRS